MGRGFDSVEALDLWYELPAGADRVDEVLGDALCCMRAELSSCRLFSQPWVFATGCCANIGEFSKRYWGYCDKYGCEDGGVAVC